MKSKLSCQKFYPPRKFTGKEWDEETGFYYFSQRYYDPEIGRFISMDPTPAPGASPYPYCADNPLRYTDPTGMALIGGGRAPVPQRKEPWQHPEPGESYERRRRWILARMSEMDPTFFYPGWWWTAGDPTINYIVEILLSSGFFTIDLLTRGGWAEINIGRAIQAMGMTIHPTIATEIMGVWGYTSASRADVIMGISLYLLELAQTGAWEDIVRLAGTIGHEATHIILKSYGLLGEPARAYQEWTAYSVEYGILESLLGPKFTPEMQRAIRNQIEEWRRKMKP